MALFSKRKEAKTHPGFLFCALPDIFDFELVPRLDLASTISLSWVSRQIHTYLNKKDSILIKELAKDTREHPCVSVFASCGLNNHLRLFAYLSAVLEPAFLSLCPSDYKTILISLIHTRNTGLIHKVLDLYRASCPPKSPHPDDDCVLDFDECALEFGRVGDYRYWRTCVGFQSVYTDSISNKALFHFVLGMIKAGKGEEAKAMIKNGEFPHSSKLHIVMQYYFTDEHHVLIAMALGPISPG
jgi:hypothetical protein